MFRKMRRFKQQLTDEACIQILKHEKRGVLSVLGDDGYPYGVPLDHYYNEENGRLYFHCAVAGHKLDAIRACDKVSYCVTGEGHHEDGVSWSLTFRSVIVFGRMKVLDDHAAALHLARLLGEKFTQDKAYLDNEIKHAGPRILMLELTPEHITGKRVNES
ncbi:pyridoxamine 5'-phosphate oxidase family protein [Mitsuokella sp. AF21-1AC]|uniref:pyridoxamine 5'-phosphate oxidase family protein n=1 Tax=Mitsuokella sp. AF21-1AC TaxID=2292235 RepID=UPI000E522714|nr:pyridoxamine 5'-phosphate oxidase family protein [Mitsuokella sp. AF21-1AC]RGS71673.1 pyridoxamine 5'-phosphate oxidase family protein [Mitsuokella sp. AF21-1AC]